MTPNDHTRISRSVNDVPETLISLDKRVCLSLKHVISEKCLKLQDNLVPSNYQIRFSRKSTPMVFLYSEVKIPLQYF